MSTVQAVRTTSATLDQLSINTIRTLSMDAVPLEELQKKFGFAPERLVAAAKDPLGRP
jgi:hypothetical protein